MPWWSLLLILLTVTVVALVKPISLQSTLYSLPIPLTLGLLGSGVSVSKVQPLSVFGVVFFFYCVSYLRRNRSWQAYPASIASALVVLTSLEALVLWKAPNIWLPSCIALLAWMAFAANAGRHLESHDSAKATISRPVAVDVVSVVAVIPMLAIVSLTADHIGSVGAMFPFAGMCVALAVETQNLPEFTRRFTIRSLGLVLYNITYLGVASHLQSTILSLALGWAAYGIGLFVALTFERYAMNRSSLRNGEVSA